MRAPPLRRQLADRSGIALPLALAALVSLSLLLTAALINATVEMGSSRAHRESVGALFAAERAVEQLLAGQGSGGAALAPGVFELVPAEAGAIRLRVARLARGPRVVQEDSLIREETFALVAEPVGSGRRVGALAASRASAALPPLGVDAALVSGGAVRLAGAGATLAPHSPACGADSAGGELLLPDGATLDAAVPPSALERHALTGEALERALLGGATMAELAERATLRLAATGPLPAVNTARHASGPDSLYNWGCPLALGLGCATEDTARLPVIWVDASGGTARLTGDYGQGVLLVQGSLEITGAFRFLGLVVAEGGVRAAPGSAVRIEGALVALGAAGADLYGADIRYSRCALRGARIALAEGALASAPRHVARGSFGWFEVTY